MARRRRAREIQELQGFSDRELWDLGLHCSDLRAIINGTYRQELKVAGRNCHPGDQQGRKVGVSPMGLTVALSQAPSARIGLAPTPSVCSRHERALIETGDFNHACGKDATERP